MPKLLLALLCSLALTACGGGGDWWDGGCDDAIDDLVSEQGPPEEVERFDAGDYHSHTYWYWSRGFSRTFTWSPDIGCEVSSYSFSPIR